MRILALALALVFAGCVSGETPVESADIQAPSDPATMPSAAAAAESVVVAEPVPTEFPFAFDGTTGTSACLPSGPSSCQGAPVETESSNTFVALEYEGTPSAAQATITWAATTPATSEMYAYLFAVKSCGERCYERNGDMFSVYVAGVSPLVLAAANIDLAEDETLILHVGSSDPTPPLPVPFFYSLEQPFSVEGVLTALVNATA